MPPTNKSSVRDRRRERASKIKDLIARQPKSAKRKPKPYKPPASIRVSGASAPLEKPWVKVSTGTMHAWVPLNDFADGTAWSQLSKKGIILFKDGRAECLSKVQNLKTYPLRPLIEKQGWAGKHFALLDGTVFSPAGSDNAVVLFDKRPDKCRRAGSVEAWRDQLAPIVAKQHVVSFALMMGFVGPLLQLTTRQGNFGFELAGSKGLGKSTLQQLVASIAGPAVDPDGRNYWITANATPNAMEQTMSEHTDMPMIIEEMNLYAADQNGKHRAAKFDELIFRLANGTIKGRFDDSSQEHFRFVYLTSTNEPLAGLFGTYRPAVSAAAADRLLTIPIDSNGRHGIFDTLADGFKDGQSMATRITEIIAKNHGVAMRAYLQALVSARATDENKLLATIKQCIDEFREHAGVDLNNGSQVRVADAFGLVFAAGHLAREWGILPSTIRCGPAALSCYQMNRQVTGEGPSMLASVLALAKHPATVRVDPKNLGVVDNATLDAAPAILRLDRSGIDELILTSKQLARHIPMRQRFLSDPEVLNRLQCDRDGRYTVKRKLRKGRNPERVYCIRLDKADDD